MSQSWMQPSFRRRIPLRCVLCHCFPVFTSRGVTPPLVSTRIVLDAMKPSQYPAYHPRLLSPGGFLYFFQFIFLRRQEKNELLCRQVIAKHEAPCFRSYTFPETQQVLISLSSNSLVGKGVSESLSLLDRPAWISIFSLSFKKYPIHNVPPPFFFRTLMMSSALRLSPSIVFRLNRSPFPPSRLIIRLSSCYIVFFLRSCSDQK